QLIESSVALVRKSASRTRGKNDADFRTDTLARCSVLLRVSADEAVPVGHLHFGQALRVHHVVLADDLVERQDVGGERVDRVVRKRLRLLPRHRPPGEVEDRCGIGPIIADQLSRRRIAATEWATPDEGATRAARALLAVAERAGIFGVDLGTLRGRAA